MWLFVSVASAGTVCSAGGTVCDHLDLVDALASGDPSLELLSGIHYAGVEVSHPIDLVADPGATISVLDGFSPAFVVTSAGSGSTFSGLVLVDPYTPGPLLVADGAMVTVSDALVDGVIGSGPPPAFLARNGSELVLERPIVRNSINFGSGMVRAVDSILTVSDGAFSFNNGDITGAIAAENSGLTVTNTLFDENYAFQNAHTLWATGGYVSIIDSTFFGRNFGHQVELWSVDAATLVGGMFQATDEGATALAVDLSGQVQIIGTTFRGWQQGAVRVGSADSLLVTGAVFDANVSPDIGGALSFAGVTDLEIDSSWFCGNQAGYYGGALSLGVCTGSCIVRDSVFHENTSEDSGGAISAFAGLSVRQSTFRGNAALAGTAIYASGAVETRQTLVIGGRGAGAALQFPRPVDFEDNGFGDNVENDASFSMPAGNRQNLDPVFVDAYGLCGPGVELAEVGENDWLLQHGVGAQEGDADTDLDGDGFSQATDCDDLQPLVHPGADELPADGVDQDCDAHEACPLDGDGDGFAGDEIVLSNDIGCPALPPDCDDTDATVVPDEDGDCGEPPVEPEPEPEDPFDPGCAPGSGDCPVRIGGGCRTSPVPGGLGGFASLVLLLLATRRVRAA